MSCELGNQRWAFVHVLYSFFQPAKAGRKEVAIMNSQKLQQFIDSHKPATVVWDIETIRSLAEKVGLEVQPHSYQGGRMEVVSWGGFSDRPRRQRISLLQSWSGKFGNPMKNGEGQWWGDHPTEKDRFNSKLSFDSTIEITWFHRIEGTKLIFWPHCPYASGSFGSGMKDPAKSMLEAAGLQEVVVEIPEPIVTLPREPWREVWVAYDQYADLRDESETMFVSEVPARVQPFIDELQKLVEDCKAKSALQKTE